MGVRKVHDIIQSGVVCKRDHVFRNICSGLRSSSDMCVMHDI